jgi:choline dehydrogenase-like flavoprotein
MPAGETVAMDAEAIVVGAGAGGGTLAHALVMAGHRVLLLERGPRFEPARDYFGHLPDWEFRDAFASHVPDDDLVTPQRLTAEDRDLASSLLRRQLRDERHFRYIRACGLGGSTLRYQGEAHRFPAHALRMRSDFGLAVDWPLSAEDLAPYYDRIEQLLGVAGAAHPAFPRARPYPNPPHRLCPASALIAAAGRELGIHLAPNPLAILSRPMVGRPACIRCKQCAFGCMIGDKSSVDVALLPAAERTGRLRILTGRIASRVLLGADGRAMGVATIAVERARRENFHAPVVVLAAGALETPRLLLLSASPEHPQGLLNQHGLVGRYLMENLDAGLLLLFPQRLKSYRGVALDSRAWDFARPQADGCNAYSLASWGAPDGLISPASFAVHVAPGVGARHRRFMERHYGAHAAIAASAEQLPRADNRLSLDPQQRDVYELPKARVTMTLDARDLHTLRSMLARCRALAAASGALETLGQWTSWDRSAATHFCGGARMGRTAADSVVNAHGQSHAIDNLFIADASVLPTQGCSASPSLTIQALALRTADFIARNRLR